MNSGEDSAFLMSSSSSPHRTSTTVPCLCRRIHPKKIATEVSEKSKLSRTLGSSSVGGWYIATGQYSSFGESAQGLILRGDDFVEMCRSEDR